MAFQNTAFQNNAFQIGQGVNLGVSTESSGPVFATDQTYLRATALGAALVLLTTVAQRPFFQNDWPVPKGPVYSVSLRTHSDNRNLTLLTLSDLGQSGYAGGPNFKRPPNQDWCAGSPLTLVGVTPFPFSQLDWPNPCGYSRNPQDWQYRTSPHFLKAPFSQSDWPNPVPVRYSVNYGTWADSFKLPLTTVTAPYTQYDWPNPRGYSRNEQLSWAQSGNALTAPPVTPNNQYDWPVPKSAERSIDLRTWLQTGYLEEVGQPFRQTNWPNPNPKLYSVNYGTWTDSFKLSLTTVAPPYLQTDWPVPKGAKSVPGFEVSGLALPSAVVTYPASITFDWPNPRGYVPAISLRTWTDSFKLPLTTVKGFNQYDWPNPRGAKGVDGFTKSGLGLTVSPFRQQDWPVPPGKISYDLRGWTDRFKLPFTGIIPLNQKDWPNPRGPKQHPDFIGKPLTFATVVVTAVPFHQTDWANPLPEPHLTVSFEFPASQNFWPPTPTPVPPVVILPRAKFIKTLVSGPLARSDVTGPIVKVSLTSNQGQTQVTGGKGKTQVKGPKGRTDVSDP